MTAARTAHLCRAFALAGVLLAPAACGGGDDGDDAGATTTTTAGDEATTTSTAGSDQAVSVDSVQSCLEDTDFRLVDEQDGLDNPRFDADAEFQVDTLVQEQTSFVGVFVYATADDARAAESVLDDAGSSSTEVVGNVVLTGTDGTDGADISGPVDQIRACVTG